MSAFEIEFSPDAEADARGAFRWYFERSPFAADAFRTELFDAVDGLASTAGDWPRDSDGMRRYHLKQFPYTVVYDLTGQQVTVFAIAHQRRRPGYWQER